MDVWAKRIVMIGTLVTAGVALAVLKSEGTWLQLLGASGSVASLFGLGAVYVQVLAVERASLAATRASEAAIRRVGHALGLADIARSAARISELRQLTDDGKYEAAWYRLEGVIEGLMRLSGMPIIETYLPQGDFESLIRALQELSDALQTSKQGRAQNLANFSKELQRLSFLLMKAETAITFQKAE